VKPLMQHMQFDATKNIFESCQKVSLPNAGSCR